MKTLAPNEVDERSDGGPFPRPERVAQPNVRMVALVVPMIVLISSISCSSVEPPEIPEHAFVDYGDHWKCERGFKRVEDECQPVRVPKHAFLKDNGDDWKCERGFRREGNRCSPR